MNLYNGFPLFQEVDEDKDGHISFREFLLIFRKFNAGELDEVKIIFGKSGINA